ncbi:MAG: NAD(P)H-binding protein [Paracoccaceae bacterium]
MKTVLIAGATGYLGRYLCAEYERRGWYVVALVRDAARAGDLPAGARVEAQATRPETLRGIMSGVDLVVSALGITRQADGLGYMDVDFQANVNLLEEAERASVGRFAYVHVLNAERMRAVPLVAAKAAFVDRLMASPLAHTVIAPRAISPTWEISWRWRARAGSGCSRRARSGSTRSTAPISRSRRPTRSRPATIGATSAGPRPSAMTSWPHWDSKR